MHNVRNALAALGNGIALGQPLDALRGGLETFEGVERRFQRLVPSVAFRWWTTTRTTRPRSSPPSMPRARAFPATTDRRVPASPLLAHA
jgi:UDP-N-acetylmuramoylalanine-D-glutamate ligase